MALREDIAKDFGSLLLKIQERVDSDLTIHCGDDVHHVHSFILEDASSFFDKACNGSFKESHTRVLRLEDDHPRAVRALVELLYQGDYVHGCEEENVVDQMCLHIRVYYFADKYDIDALSKASARKLVGTVRPCCTQIMTADEVVRLINFAYSFVPLDKSHDVVPKYLCGMILSRGHYLDSKEVLDTMRQHQDFAMDIIVTWRDWGRRDSTVDIPCPTCSGFLNCTIECEHCAEGKIRRMPSRSHLPSGMWNFGGNRAHHAFGYSSNLE